jgi:hypothetical protein
MRSRDGVDIIIQLAVCGEQEEGFRQSHLPPPELFIRRGRCTQIAVGGLRLGSAVPVPLSSLSDWKSYLNGSLINNFICVLGPGMRMGVQ